VVRPDGAGRCAGGAQIGLLFSLAARLNPHSLWRILALQTVWYGAVAMLMVGGFGPFAAQALGSGAFKSSIT
jgi:hypothetical protein